MFHLQETGRQLTAQTWRPTPRVTALRLPSKFCRRPVDVAISAPTRWRFRAPETNQLEGCDINEYRYVWSAACLHAKS
jgi:hypothetical protein